MNSLKIVLGIFILLGATVLLSAQNLDAYMILVETWINRIYAKTPVTKNYKIRQFNQILETKQTDAEKIVALQKKFPAAFQKAAIRYRKAAEQGDAVAQCNLGVCYADGIGVEKNPLEAVKWYKKAAEQGDVIAQLSLAVCYRDGFGVEKNPVEMVKWSRKAAEQGNALGQCILGFCYYKGIGVEKNPVEAAKWLKKAAVQRHVEAQKLLQVLDDK